jgi:hypothetical protein
MIEILEGSAKLLPPVLITNQNAPSHHGEELLNTFSHVFGLERKSPTGSHYCVTVFFGFWGFRKSLVEPSDSGNAMRESLATQLRRRSRREV